MCHGKALALPAFMRQRCSVCVCVAAVRCVCMYVCGCGLSNRHLLL